ncbi:MAG: TIGR01841 family phasin [Pseudomonadota bacterium]|nr:TIGR01841 family phasin [Pseudomonadota bacterium]
MTNKDATRTAGGMQDAARETADRLQQGQAAFQGAAQDAVGRMNAAGNQAFKDTVERSLSTLGQLNDVSKRNLEAMVQSMTAATRGAEQLGSQAMNYGRSSMEQSAEAARALTAAKSVQEAVELQTNYARTALEGYLTELNRMSETVANSVKESLAPINERATAAMETMQSQR